MSDIIFAIVLYVIFVSIIYSVNQLLKPKIRDLHPFPVATIQKQQSAIPIKENQSVVPGQIWRKKILDEKDPFAVELEETFTVEVLDVKNGYVKYKFDDSDLCSSCETEIFKRIYLLENKD